MLNRLQYLATIAVIFIKLLFLGCYSFLNIYTIYSSDKQGDNQLQIVFKTIMLAINSICNIIMAAILIFFYFMGRRFIVFFKHKVNQTRANVFILAIFLLSQLDFINNTLLFDYPVIMDMMDVDCTQGWWPSYTTFISLYFSSVRPIQGVAMLYMINFLAKGLGDLDEDSETNEYGEGLTSLNPEDVKLRDEQKIEDLNRQIT